MAETNQPLYRAFCRAHEELLPVFLQDWYLDAVCLDGVWNAAMVLHHDHPIGVWPWFKKKQLGFQYLAMPLFTKFLGPWLHPSVADHRTQLQIIAQLEEQLPKVDCVKADCHYQMTNWLPLYWKRYKQTTRYSYHIDLTQNLDQIFAQINRNMRRNIKSAQQQLNIRICDDPELFYHINSLSFQRQGIKTPYSLSQFVAHDSALQQKNKRYMYLAEDDQARIHSVAYLIWDDQSAYYHLSGDNPSLRHSGSGILMIWHALQYAKTELQTNIFDFEGSMMEQVGDIRRQFGAFPVPYSRIWKYNAFSYKVIDQLRGR